MRVREFRAELHIYAWYVPARSPKDRAGPGALYLRYSPAVRIPRVITYLCVIRATRVYNPRLGLGPYTHGVFGVFS